MRGNPRCPALQTFPHDIGGLLGVVDAGGDEVSRPHGSFRDLQEIRVLPRHRRARQPEHGLADRFDQFFSPPIASAGRSVASVWRRRAWSASPRRSSAFTAANGRHVQRRAQASVGVRKAILLGRAAKVLKRLGVAPLDHFRESSPTLRRAALRRGNRSGRRWRCRRGRACGAARRLPASRYRIPTPPNARSMSRRTSALEQASSNSPRVRALNRGVIPIPRSQSASPMPQAVRTPSSRSANRSRPRLGQMCTPPTLFESVRARSQPSRESSSYRSPCARCARIDRTPPAGGLGGCARR
jgi:hypothetical protein